MDCTMKSSQVPSFSSREHWWSLSTTLLHAFLCSTVNNFLSPPMLIKAASSVLPHWPSQDNFLLLFFNLKLFLDYTKQEGY
jgi:hypothetical protein